MPFDALTYKLNAKELNNALSGGRIERIGMPNKDDVILSVRPPFDGGRRASVMLLLSANPSAPRAHITTDFGENPLSAYAFLMHLRKHIGGGTITNISAVERERIIKAEIESADELGYKKRYTLVVELLGRYSNIILVGGDGKITESIKHIGFDDFSSRAVLPGLIYSLPPAQVGKVAPDDRQAVYGLLRKFEGGKLAEHMMSGVYGYAPVTMREIVYRAFGTLTPEIDEVHGQPEKFSDAVAELDNANEPCVIKTGERITEVFVAPYRHMNTEFSPYLTLGSATEAYYRAGESHGYMSGKTAHLITAVKNAIKKNAKSLALYRERLLSSENFDDDRIIGELITANIYKIKAGMSEITVDDYYSGKQVKIKLDPTLPPSANAQKYYKSYAKKKTAIEKSKEQAAIAEERADYYESLLFSLCNAENESDIAEITAEMENASLLKRGKEKKKRKPSSPILLDVDGFKVLIGKNNLQNDALVRSSDGGWLWLHAQKIHGSHGVIKGTHIPQDTINKVAAYVAHYSKASLSENVPIDYTLIKYVKKPSGAAPGKVIYTHQQTVNVKPQKP